MKSFNMGIKFRRKVELKLSRMADGSFLCLPLYTKFNIVFYVNLCDIEKTKIFLGSSLNESIVSLFSVHTQ